MYKVILIDDEQWIIKSLKTSIDWRLHGFEIVAEAFNGVEGLAKIKRFAPDIVFTDIRMPGMDGLEVIRHAKKFNENIQFIITSGHKEFEYAKKAIEYGVSAYCLKPFEEKEINDILDKYRNHRQQEQTTPQDSASEPQREFLDKPLNTTFHAVLSYIDKHYRGDLSLQSISDDLQLNLSYVSQLFRKHGEETFLQYVTKKRIAYACKLLQDSSLSIQEVSRSVGYSDYFHFAKIFKKITGLTAGQYREQHFRA